MGKVNSAHSVGSFRVNFVHLWLYLESESSMTRTLGLRWANQEQAVCLQKIAEGHTRQDIQGTNRVVHPCNRMPVISLSTGPSKMPETLFSK